MSKPPTRQPSANLQFLERGNEMGKLTREKDWSQTSIGIPETWPQSLRTILGVVLCSKFPMFLWWGPELICFYNDAYRPSLGLDGKHPSILGMKAVDAWPEIWSIIKPLIDQVLSGGEAVWSEDQLIPIFRNGNLEDVYWTFSYSPVIDEEGLVAGVLVTCSESTQKVLLHQKVEEGLNELEFAIEAAKLGTFDFNPMTNKFTANERLLEWLGMNNSTENEFVEAFARVKESDQVRVMQALQQCLDYPVGGSIDIKFTFVHPQTKSERIVHTKGRAYFNDDKIAFRMNGTMEEITEEARVQQKLEESELRFRKMADSAPALIWMSGTNKLCSFFNSAWLQFTGRKIEEEIGNGWLDAVYSEDFIPCSKTYENAFDRQEEFYMEYRLRRHDGEYRWISDKGVPRFTSDGVFEGYIGACMDIHERVLSEAILRANEEKLSVVIEASELGMYEVDLRTDIVYCSQRFNRIFGYNDQTLFTHPEFLSHLHPDDVQIRNQSYEVSKKTGILDYQSRIIWKDQSVHWIEVKGKTFYDDNHKPRTLIGTCRDITNEKNHQQELEENQAKLNLIIDATGLGTWELNIKTGEVNNSERYFEMLGYPPGMKLDHPQLSAHLYPDDVKVQEAAFENAFATGYLHYESRLIWNDGSIHWIERRGKVFYDHNKQVEKLLGTIRDITDERYYRQDLVDRERKFRLLADSMPQFVWTGRADGQLDYFNQSVFNYTGMSEAEVKDGGWLQIVHPDDRDENVKKWIHSVETGEHFLLEHRFRKKDGEYRWQLSRALPVRDQHGKIQMWVGTSTDIQDQKVFSHKLARQVQERTSELEQKNLDLEKMNKELQSFAYISSHDLQEPLRKIQTFSSRIIEKELDNLSVGGKDNFRRMQLAAKRMQTLIEDLLAYSRTNTDERRFIYTDLNKIAAQVQEDLREELEQCNAVITVTGLGHTMVIPFQFRQLLYNLISNSIKFTKEGVPPHITISGAHIMSEAADQPKLLPGIQYCHVRVSDEGIGFDPQYSVKIFEVFQRLHGKTSYTGTGIGLAIVKKIAENHNGIVTATGRPGEGATFDIYIPREMPSVKN